MMIRKRFESRHIVSYSKYLDDLVADFRVTPAAATPTARAETSVIHNRQAKRLGHVQHR